MTKKSTECYDAVFKYIEDNIMKLQPTEFMADYEASMRKSLNNQFPNAIIRGCWFHFKRALWAKCAKLGLLTFLKNNTDAKKAVTKLQNLPLLRTDQIQKGYKHVKSRAEACGVADNLKPLFDYFQKYWLRKVSEFYYVLTLIGLFK